MVSNFTQKELESILRALDPEEDYSEHRRGSTFYVGHYVEVTEEDVQWISKQLSLDITSLVGKRIYGHGTWDDDWGGDYTEVYLEEKTEEVVLAWAEVIEHPETVQVKWNKI